MKKLILLSFALATLNTKAQELQPTETMALLTVNFIDLNSPTKTSEGELVSFVGLNDKKTYSGSTKSDGKFQILIPEGQKYMVKYKNYSTELDYNTIDVPSQEGMIMFEYTLKVEKPKKYTLKDVFFDTGKATLKPESNKALNNLAEYLTNKKTVVIELEGHTDNVGEKDANQKLSEDRANSVRNYLLKKGIAPERVTAVGYGDTQPVASNDTPEGKQKNRRTQVKIIKE